MSIRNPGLTKFTSSQWIADHPEDFDWQTVVLSKARIEALEKERETNWHANRFRRYADYHDWNIPYATRLAVLTRANDHCELCDKFVNEAFQRMDLHHLTYERRYEELAEDLQLICRECHKGIHGR